MRALFPSAAALLVALGLPFARAEAAEARSSSLGWVRGANAAECIGTRALAQAVEARLGRPVFVSAAHADLAVEGQIERGPTGEWRAAISIEDEGGHALGTRDLRSGSASCHDLDEQLALVIAVMIDPDAAFRPATPLAPPAVVVPRAIVAVPPLAPPLPERWRGGLHLGAVVALGLLPHPSVGVVVRGRVTPPRWPTLEVGAAIWAANQAESSGVGARFSLTEGFASLCPLHVDALGVGLDTCLGVRGGVIRVGGFGFALTEAHERPTVAASLEGRVRRRLAGPLVLALAPGLLAPLVRDHFYFLGAADQKLEVFRMAPLVGSLEITLGLEFR